MLLLVVFLYKWRAWSFNFTRFELLFNLYFDSLRLFLSLMGTQNICDNFSVRRYKIREHFVCREGREMNENFFIYLTTRTEKIEKYFSLLLKTSEFASFLFIAQTYVSISCKTKKKKPH